MFWFKKFKKSFKETWLEVNFGQVKGWQCTQFLEFSNLKHLFTGKSNDLNLAKHELTIFPEKSVEKNRGILCKHLDLSYESLLILPQVHSDNVFILENETQKITTSDAIITHLTNIPLLITYADCVPILLFAPEKKIVGLIHAGWKGICANITEKTIIAMQENYLVRPSQIFAAIGPAIGQKNYEVSQEIADLLVQSCESDEILDNSGIKPKADLKLTNYIQLDNAGVRNIFVSELDTALHNSKLYSYRMQGKRAGRQGLIACLV